MIAQLSTKDEGAQSGLGSLLINARRRIQREARSLGPYLRVRSRVGKFVTQEEVAEAVGISRNWYVRLETAEGIRVSPTILGRVADVLMLNIAERAEMFRLAVPELGSLSLEPARYEAIETFRSLRSLGQKLWAASSEAEVMALLREYGVTQFTSDLVASSARRDSGHWSDCLAVGKLGAVKRWEKCSTYVTTNFDVALVDEFYFGALLAHPGDTVTRADHPVPNPDIAKKFRLALDVVGWRDYDFMVARVYSRGGFTVNLGVLHERRHGFTDVEREHLSAVAELGSLALLR